MEHRRKWALVGTLIGLVACDPLDDDIGKPCDRNSDCDAPLICDIHEGKGSCQEPHPHEDGGQQEATGHDHGTTPGGPPDPGDGSSSPKSPRTDTGMTGDGEPDSATSGSEGDSYGGESGLSSSSG